MFSQLHSTVIQINRLIFPTVSTVFIIISL